MAEEIKRPEDAPPAEEEDSTRVPAVDDVVQQELGERWETTREMLQFPPDMAHAMPRAVLTSRSSVDLLRSSMMHALWQLGVWDPMQLAWQKMALSVPVDGRGRTEAVEIATSAAQRHAAQQQPREGPRPR